MRFLMLGKHGENPGPPPPEFLEAMAKLDEDANKSGTMIVSGGLMPIAKSTRVRLSRGQVTAIDGPYTEAKEVVGGFAMFELKSRKRRSKVPGASWSCTRSTGRAGRARPKSARYWGWKPSSRKRRQGCW